MLVNTKQLAEVVLYLQIQSLLSSSIFVVFIRNKFGRLQLQMVCFRHAALSK